MRAMFVFITRTNESVILYVIPIATLTNFYARTCYVLWHTDPALRAAIKIMRHPQGLKTESAAIVFAF